MLWIQSGFKSSCTLCIHNSKLQIWLISMHGSSVTICYFFGTVYIFLANSTIKASGFCPEIPHQA